ncbi:MAG: phosphatidate cytidylyltransferase [Pseudomonadota bacterium]
MLLSRILTALILLPLAIAGILYLPTNYFAVVVAVIFILAAYEWTKISLIGPTYDLLFMSLIVFFMWFLWVSGLNEAERFLSIIFISVIFWTSSIFFIVLFPRYRSLWSSILLLKFLVGFMVLIPSWYALILLKNMQETQFFNTQINGSELVLIMMIMIWTADTGAYFSGKKWGKSKLIPNVSPGKTKQGAYGAIISTCIAAVIFSFTFLTQNILSSFYIVLFTVLIVIISIVGDLFESMYKRNSGIKDSGKILPGHGGVLDRIDSLTSVAPIFYVLLYVLSSRVSGSIL